MRTKIWPTYSIHVLEEVLLTELRARADLEEMSHIAPVILKL